MKAVIDSNVLVSAVIKPGGSVGPILGHLRNGRFTIIYSPQLLSELTDVLNRPWLKDKYRVTETDIKAVLGLVLLRGEEVRPQRRIALCRDPKDDKFLEAAAAGRVDVIVSGDADLLTLDPFEGIPIVRPRVFLDMLTAAGDDGQAKQT